LAGSNPTYETQGKATPIEVAKTHKIKFLLEKAQIVTNLS